MTLPPRAATCDSWLSPTAVGSQMHCLAAEATGLSSMAVEHNTEPVLFGSEDVG